MEGVMYLSQLLHIPVRLLQAQLNFMSIKVGTQELKVGGSIKEVEGFVLNYPSLYVVGNILAVSKPKVVVLPVNFYCFTK